MQFVEFRGLTRVASLFFLVFCAIYPIQAHFHGATHLDSLKHHFLKTFNESCLKYPFVHKYIDSIKNPRDKHVVFVFHERGLRNGGLGDRLAGLITAAAAAVRFNRTLLIQSDSGLHHLLRPFDTDIFQKYDLDNMIAKSNGRGVFNSSQVSTNPEHESNIPWKDKDDYVKSYGNWTWSKYDRKYADNDNTEYDLYFCINNGGSRNAVCGMDNGDVSQQIIKMRSNRAYLCRWDKHKETSAHNELRKAMEVDESHDLFEAAGCLLRLSMWPTELLWNYIDEVYESHRMNLRRQNKTISTWKHSVSLHYRCGDRGYTGHGSYDSYCIHRSDNPNFVNESPYMTGGTPIDLANCANKVIANLTDKARNERLKSEQKSLGKRRLNHKISDISNININNKQKRELQEKENKYDIRDYPMVYIASDNRGSAGQMASLVSSNNTFVSPEGCHIEMTPSFECFRETLSYWFVMSLSENIVVQTASDDLPGRPTSAFSRYASIYGLQKDPLRIGKSCDVIPYSKTISRMSQGNWMCD